MGPLINWTCQQVPNQCLPVQHVLQLIPQLSFKPPSLNPLPLKVPIYDIGKR